MCDSIGGTLPSPVTVLGHTLPSEEVESKFKVPIRYLLGSVLGL